MIKQIPNIFTLLNLFFGCLAIVYILQNGMVATSNEGGDLILMLPEQMYWASAFIGIAAVIDFLDGFVARLLKASSEMGKQLDSLADVVSFGVAPAMIIYQFLRLSFAQQPDGLDISAGWLLPAFIVPCAGAYRLARFNIDTEQSVGFKGVPIPAAGLLIASFPLIYWFSGNETAISILLSQWFWFAFIAVISYLMISKLPMMAMKFKDYSIKNNMSKYILVAAAIVCGFLLHWMAVPVVFMIYVVLSLATKEPSKNMIVPHDVTKL